MPNHTLKSSQYQSFLDETHHITLGKNAVDSTNQRFGRLIVLAPVGRIKRNIMWLCRCDCGNLTVAKGINIRSGTTRSCGCLQAENRITANTTHNLTKHPLRAVWNAILNRCTCPSSPAYKNYGGRGITICAEWRHDFQAFYNYITQLDHYGEKGYSLDRVNNLTGNYEPGNLRYATYKQQQRNRRDNLMITYNGATKCLSEWSQDTGIKVGTLLTRLKLGWPTEKLFIPPMNRGQNRKI